MPTTSPNPATILVIDDDERNRALLRSYLEPSYRVIEAADAPHGEAAFDAERPDLVILDVMLPGTSGLEACRRMKARGVDPFTPILLLTVLQDREDRHAGLEAGADDFLTKPVDRRELLLRVRAFLRIREQELVIRQQLLELRELDALKDDLVALIAHDLRNPLSSLSVILHALRRNLGDAVVQRDLVTAIRSTERVRDTIDDMLEVRQLEDGKISLRRGVLPLDALVHAAVETVHEIAADRQVTIDEALEPGLDALVDGKLIKRAVINLLSNAIRYSRDGGVVTVRLLRSGPFAEIEVSDHGPTIPADVRNALFTKYGFSTNTYARRGHGLGLYLVNLVVTTHAGRVAAEDPVEGGARFRITLPLAAT